MRNILILLIIFTIPIKLSADDSDVSVKVPWQEIKKLYQESVEHKYREKLAQPKPLFQYSMETADYRIAVHRKKALGELEIIGRVVSGAPESFPLLDKSMVISAIQEVTGGHMINHKGQGLHFLPNDGRSKTFRIRLTFLLPVLEDTTSKYVTFLPSRALKNSLDLTVPHEVRLLNQPGIKTNQGVYHFTSGEPVKIRFSDKKGLKASTQVEIDSLSRIRIQGRQAVVTTFFYPNQTISAPFILETPESAMYLSSSLKKSWVSKISKGRYQIMLPRNFNRSFTFEFAYNETRASGGFSIFLPGIKDNHGSQGIFILDQPENGQVVMTGKTVVTQVSGDALNKKLYPEVHDSVRLLKISYKKSIDLKVRQYRTVATPSVVLESVTLFSSFEENGNVLTLLKMEVPPQAGPRLSLKAIPGAEIWHLKVNQRKVKIYGDGDNTSKNKTANRWIIPLDKGNPSHVELAYVRKGKKIGLYGRLDTVMPEIGLPAKTIHVGIGLPKRVELLSLDGPVSPEMEFSQPIPAEFVGRPYYFSRSFYSGDRMHLAISYKEPVDSNLK